MHGEYDTKGLKIVGVYGCGNPESDTQAATRALVKSKKFPFPVFFDSGNILIQHYGVIAYPDSFLIDHDGKVVWKGNPRTKALEEALKVNFSAAR